MMRVMYSFLRNDSGRRCAAFMGLLFSGLCRVEADDPPFPPASPLGVEQFNPAEPEFGALRALAPASRPRHAFAGKFHVEDRERTLVFLGGSSVVDRDRYGFLEARLAAALAGKRVRFRNLGWEGDTVFYQQRPRFFYTSGRYERGVADRREKTPADIVFVELGRMESLRGPGGMGEYQDAFDALLDQLGRLTARIVVVTPAPFFAVGPAADQAAGRNEQLALYVEAMKRTADARKLLVADQFEALRQLLPERRAELTEDGLRLSARGRWLAARLVVENLGVGAASNAWQFNHATGRVTPPEAEQLIQATVAKNRLWRAYFRPTNWAFLYGNRQDTPSSRDHDDPDSRWFPDEVDHLPGLISEAESEIHSLVNPDNDPAVEQQGLALADGYRAQLFADESNGIVNPVAMNWDPRGRLWVLCNESYPQLRPGETPNDKLIVLEDADGDGRAERSHVYADGLRMPTGFALGDGGVYVGEGTELVHWSDTDGDGQADRRRVIFSGFGSDDTHQNINSFTWSPDGDLMFCQGMHAYSRIETPWGIRRADDSAVWRFNPRTLELQPYLSPKISCDNPWGLNYGRWGEMFLKGNDDQVYDASPAMIPTTNLIRMEDGYGLLGQTTSKSMAVEVVETAHLPDQMQGCLLVAGYKDQSIERFLPHPAGSTIKSRRLPKLVTSRHRAFRPVDIRIGPDGAIYVADWYNLVIGHYQESFRSPRRDKMHGRIWRITAEGRPLVQPVQLTGLSEAQLLERLRHEERWVRQQAKRLLAARPTGRVTTAINAWIEQLDRGDPDHEHHLYEALGVAASHGAVQRNLLERLLRASNPYGRAFAARMVGKWQARLPDALELLSRLATDPHPRVRIEAIVAASHVPTARAMEVAAETLDQPVDLALRFSLTQTAHALLPHWLPAISRGEELFAGRTEHAAFVYGAVETEQSARALRSLVDATSQESARVRLLKQLVHIAAPDDLHLALAEAAGAPELVAELAQAARTRPAVPGGDVSGLIRPHLKSREPAVQQAAVELAGRWAVASLSDEIYQLAASPDESTPLRLVAVDALGRLGALVEVGQLRSLLADASPQVRRAAAAALCRIDPEAGVAAAAELIAQGGELTELSEVLLPVLQLRSGPDKLATRLEAEPLAAETAQRLSQAMASAGYDHAGLQQVLASKTGADEGLVDYSKQYVEQLLADASRLGDPTRGAAVFRDSQVNCIACHRIQGEGSLSGPALTAVGRALSPELIVESILWPSRQIKEGYSALRVLTFSGRVLQGYRVAEEDPRWLVLKDPATGEITRISRDDVEDVSEGVSLMPSGLTRTISRQGLCDLVVYLLDPDEAARDALPD